MSDTEESAIGQSSFFGLQISDDEDEMGRPNVRSFFADAEEDADIEETEAARVTGERQEALMAEQDRARESRDRAFYERWANFDAEDDEYADEDLQYEQQADYGGRDRHAPTQITRTVFKQLVGDPKVYMIRVRDGKARDAIHKLTILALGSKLRGTETGVYSVFGSVTVPDIIYAEAASRKDIERLVTKAGYEFFTSQRITITDSKDAISILSPPPPSLRDHQLVRITRGPYRDDLAQVVTIDPVGQMVRLKVVPRINFDSKQKTGRQRRRGGAVRHEKKHFDRSLVGLDAVEEVVFEGEYFDRWENRIFKDGLLYTMEKMFKIKPAKNVNMDELKSLRLKPEEITKFVRQLASNRLQFHVGDRVRYISAEDTLDGVVTEINGTTHHVRTQIEDDEPFELRLEKADLVPFFEESDLVHVVAGPDVQQQGSIFSQDFVKGTAQVLLDLDHRVIDVPLQCLAHGHTAQMRQAVTESGIQRNSFVHVQSASSDAKCGVVKEIETAYATILTNLNTLERLRLDQLEPATGATLRDAIAYDAQGEKLKREDEVVILEGEHALKQGRILFIHEGHCWVHIRRGTQAPLVALNSTMLQQRGRQSSKLVNGAINPYVRQRRRRKIVSDEFTNYKIISGDYKGYHGRLVRREQHQVFLVLNNGKGPTIPVPMEQVETVGTQQGETQFARQLRSSNFFFEIQSAAPSMQNTEERGVSGEEAPQMGAEDLFADEPDDFMEDEDSQESRPASKVHPPSVWCFKGVAVELIEHGHHSSVRGIVLEMQDEDHVVVKFIDRTEILHPSELQTIAPNDKDRIIVLTIEGREVTTCVARFSNSVYPLSPNHMIPIHDVVRFLDPDDQSEIQQLYDSTFY